MSDIAKPVRPDVVPASVQHVDGPLGPLVAYLDALEARVAALERRSSAVPLMTAAGAAAYARVSVETILRAVRAGELPAAGYIGRSPRISRDALNGWLATRSSAAPTASPRPRRHRGRKASDAVEAAWEALGLTSRADWVTAPGSPLDRSGHLMDEPGDAPSLAAVDAILQARGSTPPERPGPPYHRSDDRFRVIREYLLERRPWCHDGATSL